jgi:branched-subunit amino acid ABC-type transport system permease component
VLVAANLTWDAFSQLTVVGVINGAAYGLLGVGFALILGVSGRFHFAYGFTYALAAYLVFTFAERSGIPFWISAVLGILATAIVGVLIERVVYRPLATRAGANALLAVFVASLGIGIAGENLIRLLYSSAAQQLASAPDGLRTPINWGDSVAFRWVDVWQVVTAVVLVLALAALLRFTGLGRSIKATRVNPDMARIIGIDPNRIYLVCFFIGTLMCGVAAFWFGVKFSVAADMGFKPVIFAFVVAFLAGTASAPVRVFLTGIFVSLIEQWSTMWLEVRWQQLVVFVVLLLYLVVLAYNPQAWLRRLRPAGGG